MERARSRELTAPWVAQDAWRATHGRPAGIAARQADRLEVLVQHARQASPNYVQPVIRYQLGDSVVISDRGCACGTPLATISVEGRTDEILRLPRADGGEAVLLPMAVATVVEETRGVRRYQVLHTATDLITVRLDHEPGADRAEVWQRVRVGLADLLRANGCGGVRLRLATEPPQVNPRSGKLRHVLRSVPAAAAEDLAGPRNDLV
jgi:phenylacetate-coenzyme A ligase PaaK-like adenylate-forming protein